MSLDLKEKSTGFIAEFKQFVSRGNVMDMAVGVIVGNAFKAIADSLTADLIMPVIGIFVQENSFSSLMLTVGNAQITYGNFLQSVLNFFIMAFVVFCMVKAINAFHHKKEAVAVPSAEEVLLTEIRDLLKAQQGETAAVQTEEEANV